MSLQRCQHETTSTEFIEWMSHLHKEEWETNTRLHYYLARIAWEIYIFRQTFMKTPKPLPLEDFLMKFGPKEDVERENEKARSGRLIVPDNPAEAEKAFRKARDEAAEKSKSGWLAWAGVKR